MDGISLDAYIDFYFLQAMIAQPPDLMKPAGEKLWDDIQSLNTHVVNKMTEVILQYTFIASCGEARHGYHGPGWVVPELPVGGARSIACAQSKDYAPDKHNFNILSTLFNKHWGGGYGGQKWKNITDSGKMYADGTLDKVSFIDHCANLEHNGGCYFNKSSAGNLCKLQLHFYTGNFKKFLAYKAIAPSLIEYEWESILGAMYFGTEVGELVHRYFVVTKNQQPPSWLKKGISTQWGKFEPIVMGTKAFSDIVPFDKMSMPQTLGFVYHAKQKMSLDEMYADQYTGNDVEYDEDVDSLEETRQKDETAKEYWNGLALAAQQPGEVPEGGVPSGKYTLIQIK